LGDDRRAEESVRRTGRSRVASSAARVRCDAQICGDRPAPRLTMRAYIIRSNVRISPFGDEARDLPVGDVLLRDLQATLFRKFGIEPVLVEQLAEIPPQESEARLVT